MSNDNETIKTAESAFRQFIASNRLTCEVKFSHLGIPDNNWPAFTWTYRIAKPATETRESEILAGEYHCGVGHCLIRHRSGTFHPIKYGDGIIVNKAGEIVFKEKINSSGEHYHKLLPRDNGTFLVNLALDNNAPSTIRATPPTFADILNSLALDSRDVYPIGDFEDWCANFGFDTDSRKAETMFKACQKTASDLFKLLGQEAFEQLLSLESL